MGEDADEHELYLLDLHIDLLSNSAGSLSSPS